MVNIPATGQEALSEISLEDNAFLSKSREKSPYWGFFYGG